MEMVPEMTQDSEHTFIETKISSENSGKIKSKHEEMFKATPTFEEKQEERRIRYLSQLKIKRNREIDDKRGIDEVLQDIEMSCEEIDSGSEKKHRRKSRRKPMKYYDHRIMLSEWLFSVPTDLESKWYFKVCPIGKRELVVADECITTAYNKRGVIQSQFESNLPGGSKRTACNKFTILDCIYSFQTKTYFILDIIAWNSYSYTEMSIDCRFFFLQSKLNELNESNPLKRTFMEIPLYRCEIPILEQALSRPMSQINGMEVYCDGIIFYHEDGVYRAGTTPIVLWLKPYMIPELFEIPVHENHLRYRPKTYQNFAKFTIELQEKKSGFKMDEEPLYECNDENVPIIDSTENCGSM